MKSYLDFKTQVRLVCKPDDFNSNHEKLEEIRISEYYLLIDILKRGCSISVGVEALSRLMDIGKEGALSPEEVFYYANKVRVVNNLMDS